MREMLVPDPWQGPADQVMWPCMTWVQKLPNTYCALWQKWPGANGVELPPGYKVYIVSFHLEAVDLDWVQQQSKNLRAPVVVLADGSSYGSDIDFYPFYYWHYQLNLMKHWWQRPVPKQITHKFSAICNRVTQSKLLVITQLLETAGSMECLISLGDWMEEKDIHYREKTGSPLLDHITEIFFSRYAGRKISLDGFDNSLNYQRYTSDPWQSVYQSAALHFTNESFHYSHMQSAHGSYIHPGPFLTEKTFKCLLGSTGFVPVGQFDTYGTLERLGFQFDYGFDTSWDRDSGNLSRLTSIMHLIEDLSKYSMETLYEMIRKSSEHNRQWITSGGFFDACEKINQSTQTEILARFDH